MHLLKVTREPLALHDLTPNRALKGAIEEFLQQNVEVQARIEQLQRQRRGAQRQASAGISGLEKYICAIGHSIMVDPVTAADGMNYERWNIEMWIANRESRNKPVISPVTRKPMDTELAANPQLRAEITSFLDDFDDSLGEAAESPSDEPVESVRSLNQIFAVMDSLQDVLQSVLDKWEPPRVVVIGNQSHGKSTILERLCMMPLFPRRKVLCTSVPVKISIRRGPVQRPVTLTVWDRRTNSQLGPTQVIPLESGDIDVSQAMADAIAAGKEAVKVSVNHELRVCIVSPTLPPMNLVDLPGVVEYPDDLRDQTHGLIDHYICENQESSTFLLVTKADSTPNQSGAMRHVMQHGVANRTIGVFTFCDKLDGDEDHHLLQGWLTNRPDAPDNVPLEPYGYVATMNRELKSKPDESNHARLLRQAQKEPAWFREEGFDEEIAAGLVTTQALVGKINSMYIDHVLETFLPGTTAHLLLEHSRCDLRCKELGLPASPGNLVSEAGLDKLRVAASETASRLLIPCFDAAIDKFAAHTLADLQIMLNMSLSAPVTTGIHNVKAHLSELTNNATVVCTAAVQALSGWWFEQYSKTLGDDMPPFRLQRFPGFVARLGELCAAEAPHLAPGTVEEATVFLERALLMDGRYVNLDFSLSTKPATVTISINESIVSTVLGIFASGFVVPLGAALDAKLTAIANDAFADSSQECEACHTARAEVIQRKANIDQAVRSLLRLVQPELPLESNEFLDDTVARVLPDVPKPPAVSQQSEQMHPPPGVSPRESPGSRAGFMKLREKRLRRAQRYNPSEEEGANPTRNAEPTGP